MYIAITNPVITNKFFSSKWSFRTQIKPVMTIPGYNEQIWSVRAVRYNWVWLLLQPTGCGKLVILVSLLLLEVSVEEICLEIWIFCLSFFKIFGLQIRTMKIRRPSVNFINTLRVAFALISFCQNITKRKEKLRKTLLSKKICS